MKSPILIRHICTAFAGSTRIASGDLRQVALAAKTVWDRDKWAQVLIFDDVTSNLIEVDFRGSPEDVARRISEEVATTGRAAASRPSETGRGRSRGDASAAALGLAGKSARRRIGSTSQAGGGGEADQSGQGPAPARAGGGLPVPVGDGGQRVRGSRRRRGHCSQASGIASTKWWKLGRRTSGSMRRNWRPWRSRSDE